jgi:hypothetical protein
LLQTIRAKVDMKDIKEVEARLARWSPILWVGAVVLFVSQFLFLDFRVDDAYITFSFSKNVAMGNGPVFAHGIRVEGYSNFLWMILLAPPLALIRSASPLVIARVMCVPFLIGLGWAQYTLTRIWSRSRWAATLSVYLLATSSDLALALLSGLESLAYASLVTIGFAFYALSENDKRYRSATIPVFVAAALTRIDGFIPLGFILAWELGRSLVGGTRRIHEVAKWASPGLILYVVWFVWRWSYYGMLLPSTYYAKALIPQLLPNRGLEYVRAELVSSGLVIVFGAMAIVLWLRRRAMLAAMAFVVIHLVYVVRVGGDWMPFGRFILPVVPMMICIVSTAGVELVRVAANAPAPLRRILAGGVAAIFLTLGLGMDHRIGNTDEENAKLALAADQAQHVRRLLEAVRFLSLAAEPGERLVTDYAGIFSYYTDAAVIDMWGLCTPMIARNGETDGINPIYGRTCPSCYSTLAPDLFHVQAPLLRPAQSFSNSQQVIDSVWQSETIGKYVDLRGEFLVGRVRNEITQESLYFLERRTKASQRRVSRSEGGTVLVVEYPFERS